MKDKFHNRGKNWSDIEIKDFTAQLIQVIKWTEQLSAGFDHNAYGAYGTVFRQTNPVINGKHLYNFDDDYTTWNLDVYDAAIFEKLLNKALIARDDADNMDLRKMDDLGRILCFQGVFTTHDGAAIADSQCFVDESDVPPIDTWFFLKKNYYHQRFEHTNQTLFCWIPKAFEPMMQNAIDVEMMDSYDWLDEYDPSLHRLLKSDLYNL